MMCFDEEIRDGFLITEAMKRYWAASLVVLQKFADVCAEHKIKWWADWGTLLGTVRHGGYIPWDDDLDIGMPYEDYMRFLDIVEASPVEFVVATYDSPYHKYNGISVVVNHREVSFDESALKEYFDCPFPVGFDIFPYHVCPNTDSGVSKWRSDGISVLTEMERIRKQADFDTNMLINLGRRVDEIAGMYSIDNGSASNEWITYTIFLSKPDSRKLNITWYDELEMMTFENIMMPVPREYASVLDALFGKDYMTPHNIPADHEYPLYRRDILNMIEFLGKGGMSLSQLPPQLEYIRREADVRGIAYV